jgi:basic membrane protein A and related proteins
MSPRCLASLVSALLSVVWSLISGGTPAGAQQPLRAAAIFSVANPGAQNGWDRGQFQGVQDLMTKHGWKLTVAEDVPFPRLAETAANYGQAGYDVVIFTSSGHIAAWNEVAAKYPKTWFALMSLVDKLPDAPNVAAYSPDLFMYGALSGATAAAASRSKKIAGVGGVPVHGNIVLYSGVIEGVKATRPDVEVFTAFSGSWVDVARAREVSALQFQRGADVIVANAGPATRGILDAGEAAKGWIIGYATDWYADSHAAVLTSVLLNIPTWYAALARDFAGRAPQRRIVTFGADTFSLTDFHGKLSPGQEREIRDLFARMQRGDIKVPVRMHPLK